MITSTDMDGRFLFSKVPSGSFTLVITAVGYQKVSITNLEVGPGATVEKIVSIKPAVMEIEEFTVESKKVNNTEGALGGKSRFGMDWEKQQLDFAQKRKLFFLSRVVNRHGNGHRQCHSRLLRGLYPMH